MANLMTEVGRFREWADRYPPETRSAEWECEYEHWNELHDAVLGYVVASPPEAWSGEALRAVLYALARDNEDGHLAGEIGRRHPATLMALTKAALVGGEFDVKWQFATQLGDLGREDGEVERLLLILACDEHEYVRRRALEALTRVDSPTVERLALEAWNRPDENQQWARMMTLDCLNRIGSPHLERLLAEADRDEGPYLRDFAQRIRRGRVD